MKEDVLNFYFSKPEPNQSCLLTLKSIILDEDPNISESIKWGLPCFSYKKKMFCFLSIDKKNDEPYILFVEGNNLDFPELVRGDRKRMKVLPVNPNTDIPIKLLRTILNTAIDLYRSGTISA